MTRGIGFVSLLFAVGACSDGKSAREVELERELAARRADEGGRQMADGRSAREAELERALAAAEEARVAAMAPTEEVVIDEYETFGDGYRKSWRITPGRYTVEMTATGDGGKVTWTGVDCENSRETRSYDANCTVSRTAQLTVENPTAFGMGDSSTISVRVTKHLK
jgi:hypothetical protein